MMVIAVVSAAILAGLGSFAFWIGASPLAGGNRTRPLQQIRHWQALATFLDHLALLTEHRLPLAASIDLAGNAVAWPPLAKSANSLAQRISLGETRWTVEPPMPPVVGWLLQITGEEKLPAALRREAEYYRRRSDRRQRWFTLYFPMLATLAVGVLCLALLTYINLVPLVNIYYQLSASQP
jgi:type II secretory pathway component PulF